MHAASPCSCTFFSFTRWRTGASTHLSTRSAIEFLSTRQILLVEFHRDAMLETHQTSSDRPFISSLSPSLFSFSFQSSGERTLAELRLSSSFRAMQRILTIVVYGGKMLSRKSRLKNRLLNVGWNNSCQFCT